MAIQIGKTYTDEKGEYIYVRSKKHGKIYKLYFDKIKQKNNKDDIKKDENQKLKNRVEETRIQYKKLKEQEENDKDETVEYIYIVDEKGNIIYRYTDNSPTSIDVPYKDLYLFKDAISSHNHPNGTPFSKEDLDFAVSNDLKQFRATGVEKYGKDSGKHVTHSVTRVNKNNISDDFGNDYLTACEDYAKNVLDPMYSKGAKGKTLNGMWTDFMSNWLKDNANKYGYRYKKEVK